MKFFKCILSVMMCLSMIVWASGTVNVQAQEDYPEIERERSKSKTATNLDENYDSEITLAVPSAEYKDVIDVAIVVDASTSTDLNAVSSQTSELLSRLSSLKNLTVKVAVVVSGGYDSDTFDNAVLANTGLGDISDSEFLAKVKEEIETKKYRDKKVYPTVQAVIFTLASIPPEKYWKLMVKWLMKTNI